ncbi:PilZ domain-containing protein [Georgfuchsia toluolica]|nr:PilZ domain-containing protein [Georgfuchsia toluolica]
MLRIFSGKSDHPLADTKSARELFDRLIGSDPFEALDEIDSWLESVSGDEEIKPQRRVNVLFELDDIGTAAARKLTRGFLAKSGSGHGQSRNYKLWQTACKFWRQLAASYGGWLDQFEANKKLREEMRATLPMMQMRLLRAYSGCLKWEKFRYGSLDPDLWLSAGRLYLEAEKNRWLEKKLALGDGTSTTIAAEYLRLLLFHAASMDRLQPLEIELAEQLLSHFLPAFSLTAQVRPENVYWVDAAKPLPPTRLAKLPGLAPTLRFFATANACSAIEALCNEISQRQTVPNELVLNQQFPVATVIAVLRHLAAFCAPQPPVRSHVRHQVKSRIRAVDGFQAVFATLRGDDAISIFWTVEDVSEGGMRTRAEMTDYEGLGIGALVAMYPEGGDYWLIGIVRRIDRENRTQGNIGIETVGRAPIAVDIDSEGLKGEGLLLDSALNASEMTSLVVSPGIWQDSRPLTFVHGGQHYRLRPQEERYRGNDYVIGCYWVDVLAA